MPETPLQQRWGGVKKNSALSAKERLIQAAQICYSEKGIQQTTIADIATAAKITRRTVYRYFSSHEEILLAVFEEVVDDYWQDLHRDISYQGSFAQCVVEALLYSLDYAYNAPRHQYMFNAEAQAITNKAYISHTPFTHASAKGLQHIYQLKLKQKQAKEDLDLLMLAEWFNRLILSFLSSPSPLFNNKTELKRLFSAMLAPALE